MRHRAGRLPPSRVTRHATRELPRDRFFEFLEPGDPESVLIQFSIGHMPLNVHFGTWQGFGSTEPPDNNIARAKMKIDYLRVFQPIDRYSGMEPVYE